VFDDRMTAIKRAMKRRVLLNQNEDALSERNRQTHDGLAAIIDNSSGRE